MRQLVCAGLALASMACAASAADLGSYGYTPPASYGPPPFTWSGFYLGVQGGYGWSHTEAYSGQYASAFDQYYNYNGGGLIGGLHAGYNWQISSLVLGLETDIEGSRITGSGSGTTGDLHGTDINWQGSVRGRLGYASGNTLFYLTSGLAYADTTINKSMVASGLPSGSFSDWRAGWTLGGGIEHAFTNNITARLEYRYADYGSINYASQASNAIDHSALTSSAVRAGLSFKF